MNLIDVNKIERFEYEEAHKYRLKVLIITISIPLADSLVETYKLTKYCLRMKFSLV